MVPIAGTPVKSVVFIFPFLFVASTSQISGIVQRTVALVRNSVCRINFKHVKCISRSSKIITFFRVAFREKTLSK